MSKKLTPQILMMYLGCECMVEYDDHVMDFKMKLVGMNHEGDPLGIYGGIGWPRNQTIEIGKVKPILRRLNSMTEEDSIKIFRVKNRWKIYADPKNKPAAWIFDAEEFTGLLANSFDLFGLIDSGEAVAPGGFEN